MYVAVEVLLEDLQRIEKRAVGVAECGSAVVVVAQDPQGDERVAKRRVLGFVIRDHTLFDGYAGLLRGEAGGEQLVLLAGQVRLQLGADLAQATLSLLEAGIVATVNPHHRTEQALEFRKGLTQAVVVDRHYMGAQLGRTYRTPVSIANGARQGTFVERFERGKNLVEVEPALGAGGGQRLAPAAAVVKAQLLEELSPSGALADKVSK